MANDYTSSTDAFRDISEGGYSSSDYPQMATMVTAASRLIDRECGVWPGFFYPTTDDKTLIYDGSGYDYQRIDPFVSITSVSVSEQGGVASSDYTAWGSSDYMTWPYNATVKSVPITELRVDALNGSQSAFYAYPKSVKVVGVAGYSVSPPDVIVQAAKVQAIRWFMRAKQAYKDIGATAELGSLTFTELDPDVKLLLWPLKLELSE